MPDAPFQALKTACVQQISWLQAHAREYGEAGCQHLEMREGVTRDRSLEIAEEFRHQANNLQAVLNAYERLRARTA